MSRKLPSVFLMRNILRYDPQSGLLVWRKRRPLLFKGGNTGRKARADAWNKVHCGALALNSQKDNHYLYGRVFDRNFYAHRVAWAIYHGRWPQHEIDHINGDRTDNRIANLREASRVENMRNCKGRSGRVISGIYWSSRCRSWHVQVNREYTGSSKCFAEAVRLRNKKYKERGFTKRHGLAKMQQRVEKDAQY